MTRVLHIDLHYREEMDFYFFEDLYNEPSTIDITQNLESPRTLSDVLTLAFDELTNLKDSNKVLDGIIINPNLSLDSNLKDIRGYKLIKEYIRNIDRYSSFDNYFSNTPVLFYENSLNFNKVKSFLKCAEEYWIFDQGFADISKEEPQINSYLNSLEEDKIAFQKWLRFISNPKK